MQNIRRDHVLTDLKELYRCGFSREPDSISLRLDEGAVVVACEDFAFVDEFLDEIAPDRPRSALIELFLAKGGPLTLASATEGPKMVQQVLGLAWDNCLSTVILVVDAFCNCQPEVAVQLTKLALGKLALKATNREEPTKLKVPCFLWAPGAREEGNSLFISVKQWETYQSQARLGPARQCASALA